MEWEGVGRCGRTLEEWKVGFGFGNLEFGIWNLELVIWGGNFGFGLGFGLDLGVFERFVFRNLFWLGFGFFFEKSFEFVWNFGFLTLFEMAFFEIVVGLWGFRGFGVLRFGGFWQFLKNIPTWF